jgi:leucyl-tRNA synthetase
VLFGGIEKMSKSKNNVVEPRDIIERFGADTARAYVMFAGPPAESAVWSDSGAEGVHRFLRRLWTRARAALEESKHDPAARFEPVLPTALSADQAAARRNVHLFLSQALHDYDRVQYNTVVSACMKMLNEIEAPRMKGCVNLTFESLGILVRTLYPIAPHITHVLWKELGFAARHGDLLDARWLHVEAADLHQEEMEIIVQVNGKLRGRVTVPADATEAMARDAALADANVQKFVADNPLRKVIYVPKKLVNLVV